MKILALDPGTTQTGWAVVSENLEIIAHAITSNHQLLNMIKNDIISPTNKPDKMAVEMISSQGMAVGKSVFETCVWIGRFIQAWREPEKAIIVYRHQVKMRLCNSMRAKDSNIRQAIIDLYPATGGGSVPQIGNKAQPGPLYGVSSHVWPALGVALVAHSQSKTFVLPDTLPLYQSNGEVREVEGPF